MLLLQKRKLTTVLVDGRSPPASFTAAITGALLLAVGRARWHGVGARPSAASIAQATSTVVSFRFCSSSIMLTHGSNEIALSSFFFYDCRARSVAHYELL